jgi:hypothetical protein
MIWKYTVPDPRSIRGVILFLINYDLSSPRAIMPSIRQLKAAFEDVNYHAFQRDKYDLKFWDMHDDRLSGIWSPILSLMHTCPLSRSIVPRTYCIIPKYTPLDPRRRGLFPVC